MPGMDGMGTNGSVIVPQACMIAAMAMPSLHPRFVLESLEKMFSHYIVWGLFTRKALVKRGSHGVYLRVYHMDVLCF